MGLRFRIDIFLSRVDGNSIWRDLGFPMQSR